VDKTKDSWNKLELQNLVIMIIWRK